MPPLPPDVEETVCNVASEDEMFGDVVDAIVPHYGCDNLYVIKYCAVNDSVVSIAKWMLWGGHERQSRYKIDLAVMVPTPPNQSNSAQLLLFATI